MSKFKARNLMTSAKNSFYYRVLYDQQAFDNFGQTPEVRDLTFAENILYGRVDTRLNTVFPDESRLKFVANERQAETGNRLMNFAADAFTNVRAKITQAKEIGTIPSNDPIFSSFDIKAAYVSPISLYNNYIQLLMEKYISHFLEGKNIKEKVFNIDDFIQNFIDFLNLQPDHVPFTFSSWQRSKTSNIFTSGIALSIANLAIGEDRPIERNFLQSPCFPFYLKICRANGFLVSETSPFVMVADILSPGLLPYVAPYGIVTEEEVFLKNYNYAYMRDYDFMINNFTNAYNSFVNTYPIERISVLRCQKKISTRVVNRFSISPEEVEETYHPKYWYEKYSKIRNMEEEGALSDNMMKKLLRTIKIQKNVDKMKSMRYINNAFRDTYKNKYGGINYFIRKQEEKNSDTQASIYATSTTRKIDPKNVSVTTGVDGDTEETRISTGDTSSDTGGSSGGTSGGY